MTHLPVSVLMPIRIRPDDAVAIEQLQRAIESVVSQCDSQRTELLILDDASSRPLKDYRSALACLRHKSIRIVRFSRHQGIVAALNTGLALSSHEWVARIDADDYWAQGKLEAQFRVIDTQPDVSLVATGMHLVTPQNIVQSTHIRPGTWTGILQFTRDVGSPFPHGSILARRSAFRVLGGYDHDPILRHCEDFALWCSWIRFLPVAMVEAPLYNYTVSERQVSSEHSAQQRTASSLVHGKYLSIPQHELIPEIITELAKEFEISILEFGLRLCLAWRCFNTLATSPVFVDRVRQLCPDREVLTPEELGYSHAERYCHVGPHPLINAPQHTRCHGEFMQLSLPT
jgi:glycosyltransferase involved in cell wall biosynthesis